MTADDYKSAIAELGFDHEGIAARLGITSRTSYRYAKVGAPKRVALLLENLIDLARLLNKRADNAPIQRKGRKAA